MKVLIRNKVDKSKLFMQMKQITIKEQGDGKYRVSAVDLDGKKIILNNIGKDRAEDIECRICQDYIIDLTDDFESFTKKNEQMTRRYIDNPGLDIHQSFIEDFEDVRQSTK